MAVGYQSFYQAQLTSNISDTDLTIPVDVAPTPDEGFLVLESTVTNKREIIYYTSKTANSVICPSGAGNGRGYDGTTAVAHLQGAAVIMAPVGAMFSELRDQFTTTPQGWTNLTQAVSTVTHNGNRSYSVVFDSTVASTLTPGMRLEFTKTVAGNGYMGGAFNGSSHYFTKTTPSGTLGTVTNNFTIEAVVQPTSYAQGYLCGRSDATPNNGLGAAMLSDGRVQVIVFNVGSANYRSVATYQSLPLNKKTHVAYSWSSGTVVIYFDGIAVPTSAAVTSGTAPTTAGTGGDFSVGRFGAAAGSYFPGYISNVAVFDAVLSAATIRQHATYKLTGSETNCIGAWSLDNTANDQSSAGNNLTATGGVGYTAMTPHGQLDSGVQTTKAVGLVMNVSTSTVTVQVPEGVTINTTGGITSVAYSTQANPFGWVSDKGRWYVLSIYKATAVNVAIGAINDWFVSSGHKITVPVGAYTVGYEGNVRQDSNASGTRTLFVTMASSTPTSGLWSYELTSRGAENSSTFLIFQCGRQSRTPVNHTVATDYSLYGAIDAATGAETWAVNSNQGMMSIYALPSGL